MMKKLILVAPLSLVCLFSQVQGQSSGDLRLATGTSSFFTTTGGSSGRLEIYFNGEWGTVCDDFFFSDEANVACRQLGYNSALSYGSVSFSNSLSSSSVPIWLDNVNCFGSESRLEFCSNRGIGRHDCSHFEDVELVCTSINVVGIAVGVTVGVVVLIIIGVVLCIVCCVCCIASSSRSKPVTTVVQPTTSNVVYTATTQTASAYPQVQQTYTQAPAAYPPEPRNPELQAGAPPGYNDFTAYPPAQNAGYPPEGDTGYPPQGALYPPQGDTGYLPQGTPYPPQGDTGYPPQGASYPSAFAYPPQGY